MQKQKKIKTAYYEHKRETLDLSTGEIISESKTTLSRYSVETALLQKSGRIADNLS